MNFLTALWWQLWDPLNVYLLSWLLYILHPALKKATKLKAHLFTSWNVRTGNILGLLCHLATRLPLIPSLTIAPLDKLRCSNFQPVRFLDPDCWYKFTYLLTNSAEPDQLASDLDLHCLQRCRIFWGWLVRQRCHVSYVIGASNWDWLTVGQGLLSLHTAAYLHTRENRKKIFRRWLRSVSLGSIEGGCQLKQGWHFSTIDDI